jgi:hypothetical protein
VVESGLPVVSINDRLIPDVIAEKIDPPVKACLDDAARTPIARGWTRRRGGRAFVPRPIRRGGRGL